MARILLLTHISLPAIDGGSKVVHKMGDYFQNKGHQILRLSSNCSSTDDFVRSHQPVNHQLPVYIIFHKLLKHLPFNLTKILQKGPIFKLFPFLQSLITVLRFRPHLIIAGPLPTTIILYTKFSQLLSNVLTHQPSKVLFNASYHPTDPEFQNPIFTKLLKSFDYLWTLTEYETNYFKKLGFKNTLLLGNGVDSNFIINPSKIIFPTKPTLLFVGSFSAHKGLDQIISLSTQFPQINFILAGQTTLYSQKLNFDKPNIKIIIKPSDKQIKKLIDNCTALLLPSHQESFGLVLIEAMARGKPVLVSNIPQLSELIQKTQSGLVINPQNINTIINKPQQFGLNGLEYVANHYTWDRIGDRLCQKLSL